MENVLKVLHINTQKMKEKAIRQKMIEYYRIVNEGKVSIPPFMLAELEIQKLKRQGRIDEVYTMLEKAAKEKVSA
uniref:Uncharacterized protein n=1 Tax=Dulem virus 31 TaxID=3145749 RepID=A0AAU8AVD7_9VIRU